VSINTIVEPFQNVIDNNDIVLSAVGATEIVDNMIAKSCTGRQWERIFCSWVLRGTVVSVEWPPGSKRDHWL